MNEMSTRAVASRRTSSARPGPSWSDLLAQLGRGRNGSRTVEAPPAREWRDLVADLIAGRR